MEGLILCLFVYLIKISRLSLSCSGPFRRGKPSQHIIASFAAPPFMPELFVPLVPSTYVSQYVEVHSNTSGASSVNMQQSATLSASGHCRAVVEGLVRLRNSPTKKIYKFKAPHVCALLFSGDFALEEQAQGGGLIQIQF